MFKRGSGILLHLSSLPAEFGIGDLGPSAYQFVDFLCESKQKYWQILPINPTDTVYGNSPYSSPSAFAANSLFLSPQIFLESGWLDSSDLISSHHFPETSVNYRDVTRFKAQIYQQAYQRFKKQNVKEFENFCQENTYWLEDFATFMALKIHFGGKVWNQWPKEMVERTPKALKEVQHKHFEAIECEKFLQFAFLKQWKNLKDYANKNHIRIIGDIPIYINFDSADVWANPQYFKLDHDYNPLYVAGVPPDYFSETGQRWGNPVYNWDQLKENHYEWWIQRIRHNLKFFDIIRIDHFRGFVNYWQIPAEEKTAVKGEWMTGPKDEFFVTLKKVFKELPILAEDLGIITPDVTETMNRFGFPGMKVLLFAFGGDLNTNPYIPENYTSNCIVYTGTHDNNTILGWLKEEVSPSERENLYSYLGKKLSDEKVVWKLIKLALRSKANVGIIPMQDFLQLGQEARMNIPATTTHNWEWRLAKGFLTPTLAKRLARLTVASKRS